MINAEFAPQTISWFNDRINEKSLLFKPPFQRNPVWKDKHKAYLADTVLRSLPIPEIYIQKETDASGKTIYSIVDGQQRMRALLAFVKNEVQLMEDYTAGRDGETWDDLTETEKIAFWNYRIVVREITGATDNELRDLFRRLNQHTVVLNAQEIRNARFKGEFLTVVTDLADQDFWAEHRIVTANEIRRMLDIEFVAELLVGLMHGPQNKKTSLDGFFESYDDAIPDKQKWLALFEKARAMTLLLIPDLGATRWRGKNDYYALFLACAALLADSKSIPKTKFSAAGKALKQFGDQVTSRLSKEGAAQNAPKAVRTYATSLQKSTSDKDRRQTRLELLSAILKPYAK